MCSYHLDFKSTLRVSLPPFVLPPLNVIFEGDTNISNYRKHFTKQRLIKRYVDFTKTFKFGVYGLGVSRIVETGLYYRQGALRHVEQSIGVFVLL